MLIISSVTVKISIFVLLAFILSFHLLQYLYNIFKLYCRSAAVVGSRVVPSAYNKQTM